MRSVPLKLSSIISLLNVNFTYPLVFPPAWIWDSSSGLASRQFVPSTFRCELRVKPPAAPLWSPLQRPTTRASRHKETRRHNARLTNHGRQATHQDTRTLRRRRHTPATDNADHTHPHTHTPHRHPSLHHNLRFFFLFLSLLSYVVSFCALRAAS